MDELSDNLRARVLEILALVFDPEAQRNYQTAVPHVDVPAELFNQWEDSFFPMSDRFRAAFSAAELDALRHFDDILREVSAQTANQLPVLDLFIGTPAWERLSAGAGAALQKLKR